jgi:ABC-type lipoprotein release transport system permease subunit
MSMLLKISLRNLLRQKRRNLLLGSAIAIGMALLILANAFAHGISDVLFNRVMAFVTGHVSVGFSQNGNRMAPVFRNAELMRAKVAEAAPEVSMVQEAIGIFARAIGNGRADNVILVSLNLREVTDPEYRRDLEANFHLIAGSYASLTDGTYDHPVIIADDKAKYLRVGLNDVIKVRFQDIEGRQQAARLTVAGIFKPANAFMSAPVFLGLNDIKQMAGYGPTDLPQLYLTLRNPKEEAFQVADRLHRALRPPVARIVGGLSVKPKADRGDESALSTQVDSAAAFAYRIDSASLAKSGLPNKGVFASATLARALGLAVGDTCTLRYLSQFPGMDTVSVGWVITGILPDPRHNALASGTLANGRGASEAGLAGPPGHSLLVSDREFYAAFYGAWPREVGATAHRSESKDAAPIVDRIWQPDSTHPWWHLLGREWVLLERTSTTSELQKKWSGITRLKTKATTVDVNTMYETASMVVNLELALNLITLVAVLILFFIIQVGVVNTLRMTIRERTREIGTMRSIGMHKADVRNLFLLETLSLTAIAGTVGIGLAFVGMHLLSGIQFKVDGNPISMILIGGHLNFVPKAASILLYSLLIMGISTATAFFPARRASNMQPSDALRHYG